MPSLKTMCSFPVVVKSRGWPFSASRELTNRLLLSRRRLLLRSCPGSASRTIWRQNLITIRGRRLVQSNFLVTCLPLLEECCKYILQRNCERNYERNAKLKRHAETALRMHTEKDLSTTESLFCCMMRTGQNPDFPYWNYERFELDELTNAQCNAEFRFYKNDIHKLADALQLPDEFVTTYNGLIVESIPALCIYLKRFSYPCRYSTWYGFSLYKTSPRDLHHNKSHDWLDW